MIESDPIARELKEQISTAPTATGRRLAAEALSRHLKRRDARERRRPAPPPDTVVAASLVIRTQDTLGACGTRLVSRLVSPTAELRETLADGSVRVTAELPCGARSGTVADPPRADT